MAVSNHLTPNDGDRAAVAKAQAAVAEVLEARQQSTVLAGVMIAAVATTVSSKIDTFATWLLAAFGAAVALLLTSHEAAALIQL